MYEIDKHLPGKKLDPFMYDTSVSYIKISYLHGVIASIKNNEYFKAMSPKLKNKPKLEKEGVRRLRKEIRRRTIPRKFFQTIHKKTNPAR